MAAASKPAVSRIPFNRPFMSAEAKVAAVRALDSEHHQGMGPFTELCQKHLEALLPAPRVLLTQSCTAALELAAFLARIGPGDEVIMPSYTFVSTANAFVLRQGVPVFVDIRADTLNLDEKLVEQAITPRTRAICVVHYGGVGCDMDAIGAIAESHGLIVIEDAAQGLGASWGGRALGTLGQLGAISFHATKNIGCGEGGALIINDPDLVERAEILWEKGTNRLQHHRGEVNRYRWLDLGSSFLPSEITAAILAAQLEHTEAVTQRRRAIWARYQAGFSDLERRNQLMRPAPPENALHNGHIYHLVLPERGMRDFLLNALKRRDIHATTHYVPLHSAPAGQRFARAHGGLPNTALAADQALRLPMHYDLSDAEIDRVIAETAAALAAA